MEAPVASTSNRKGALLVLFGVDPLEAEDVADVPPKVPKSTGWNKIILVAVPILLPWVVDWRATDFLDVLAFFPPAAVS